MIQSIENGGLKLVDFESKVKSLKLGFIKRLMQNKTGKWRHTAAKFYKTNDLNYYFKCNRIPSNIGNKFYEETLHYWSELQEIRIPTVEIIHNQTIWENRHITISNRPYIWSNWAAKGIVKIHDIIKENGDFLNHSEIKENYDINCNFLNYLQIRHSLPMEWRQLIRNKPVKSKINEPFVSLGGRIVPICDTETNTLYKQFIKYKYKKPAGITKWNATATSQIMDDEWSKIFQRSYQTIWETKIQSLQFKIIHRIINCNKKLFDMKIKETPKCSYCDAIDDIPHFFMRCENVLDLWTRFFNWWNQVCYRNVNFPTPQSENEILFGLPNNGDNNVTLNFCMLHIKHYIYKQRLFHENEMQFGAIKNVLSVKLEIEKNILSRENKPQKFELLYNKLNIQEQIINC